MKRRIRAVAVAAVVAAASFTIHADKPSSHNADIQLQLAQLFFQDGRYVESLDAFQKALAAQDPSDSQRVRTARVGVVQSALRVAEFTIARREAEQLLSSDPRSPEVLSLYGDSLWASGLFDEAETKYRDALAVVPEQARAHHGIARSLLAPAPAAARAPA